MSDVPSVMRKLEDNARQLDGLSRQLSAVGEEFARVAEGYREFVDDYEVGLYFKSESEGTKLPSEAMRLKLAHKAMNPEALGRYMALKARKESLAREIRDLKAEVEINRTIMSTLRIEMEATR
jgi:septal ring factor EnvC (AmiA/AmiB activator)